VAAYGWWLIRGMVPTKCRDKLIPLVATAHLIETVAIACLDRPNLLRREIRLQGPIRILAVLDTKCLVPRQPANDGLNLFDSDGNHLPGMSNTSPSYPKDGLPISPI